MGKHRLGHMPVYIEAAPQVPDVLADDGANTDYVVAATDGIGSASTREALSNLMSYDTGALRAIGDVATGIGNHLLDRLDTVVGAAYDLVATPDGKHRS